MPLGANAAGGAAAPPAASALGATVESLQGLPVPLRVRIAVREDVGMLLSDLTNQAEKDLAPCRSLWQGEWLGASLRRAWPLWRGAKSYFKLAESSLAA
jgi:hypothetical protein